MQDEKLPLHYAAMSGAPFDVMKLLLDANPEAATAADKARSSAHAARPTLLPQCSCVSPLVLSQSPRDTNAAPHASYTHRERSYLCTTLRPKARRSR